MRKKRINPQKFAQRIVAVAVNEKCNLVFSGYPSRQGKHPDDTDSNLERDTPNSQRLPRSASYSHCLSDNCNNFPRASTKTHSLRKLVILFVSRTR